MSISNQIYFLRLNIVIHSTIIQQSNFAINQFNPTGNILSKCTFDSIV